MPRCRRVSRPGHSGAGCKPCWPFWPGATAWGKRPIRQLAHDLFGLSISTGMVAKLERSTADALAQPMAELEEYVRTQHANVDETSWREAMHKAWLWVAVTPLVTVFHIAATRCGKVAGELLGSAYRQVVTSDRWKAYNGFRRRQFCWAHLRRDFQAMIDRQSRTAGQPSGRNCWTCPTRCSSGGIEFETGR